MEFSTEEQRIINSLSTISASKAFKIVDYLLTGDKKNEAALAIRPLLEARLIDAAEKKSLEYADWRALLGESYRARAVDFLEDYLIYLEWNRPKEKKFYEPRRVVLHKLVELLQRLEEGEFEILSVSLPPRTGKSTMGVFFMTWVMGRNPAEANVMSGHSDKLTDGFFREALSIITDDETYNWSKVFPNLKVVRQNTKDEIIDLDQLKRYPTLTCRSVEGTLTGAVEAGNYLYCDDLVSDLEEALSKDRLAKKYDAYANQLKDRKKQRAKEIHIGTRWSVFDPIGVIKEKYRDTDKYRELVIPALDENGKSNFKYDYELGFDEEYYADIKMSIDDATWRAKYMGQPIEREGLLFDKESLKYFNGKLPPKENLVKKFAFGDVAWGGGDFLSMPIIYEYENGDMYLVDVVFNKGNRDITQPLVAGKIKLHKPHEIQFEANNGGAEYAQTIDTMVNTSRHERYNIRHNTKPSTKAKVSRIIQEEPKIKDIYYLSENRRSSEYEAFMENLTSYTVMGKNKNDDAPDSLAGAMKMNKKQSATFQIFERFF